MEEFVGVLWDRWVSANASTDYREARVELNSVVHQLGPFYRALGGSPAKVVEAVAPRSFKTRRRLIQRVAGSHRRFAVSWQDERSVRLPSAIAYFPSEEINRELYFWLAAMAAELPVIGHWFSDNQQATERLLQRRPGLARSYRTLVDATLAIRPALGSLEGVERQREEAIQEALKRPNSVALLPKAPGDPTPVPLWLYPQPLQSLPIAVEDAHGDHAFGDPLDGGEGKKNGARKPARRVDENRETDGLLVFQLPSLLTLAEQVNLDRSQDEDDEAASAAAEDMELIQLSRQRRAQGGKVRFDLDLPAAQNDDLPVGEGIRQPEWNFRQGALVPDYCLVQPMLADRALPATVPDELKAEAEILKRRFSSLQPQQRWCKRQPFGDELDLDAWIDRLAQPKHCPDREDHFQARRASHRDLSCLVLADLSLSTDSMLSEQRRVIDVIRDALLLFAEALDACGDPFALYGFSSISHKQVRYHLLKNFAEPYCDAVRGRIQAIRPGFYTRMGAAIRQSTMVLEQQASAQRLLLILSDGKPNDLDHYEGRYGIEDTRQAVLEARRKGLLPFCVAIDDSGDDSGSDYLPHVFGERGFALVDDISRLPQVLPTLYLQLTERLL